MSKPVLFLYVSSVLILAMLCSQMNCSSTLGSIKKEILAQFENKPTKQIFKVFHFIFHKTYDYNSDLGVKKYMIFRANLKKIRDHNRKNLSYKMGIQHFSDMTNEEVDKYYNLKPIKVTEYRRMLKGGAMLDDFNDDEEIREMQKRGMQPNNKVPVTPVKERKDVDWRGYMGPVRNQGNCGSCWAFGTIGAIEGNWAINNNPTDFSPQELVDCDTNNYGCSGGWYRNAINFFKEHQLILLSNYPYTAKVGTCQYSSKPPAGVKTTGYTYAGSADTIFALLEKGPVGVAVDANESFKNYSSGVFDGPCAAQVTHAMVTVGFDATQKAWILRNSWGEGWGDYGHILVKENYQNSNSCMAARYGYLPLVSSA